MEGILKLVVIGVVSALLATTLKPYRPDFAMVVAIFAGAFILYNTILMLPPIIEVIKGAVAAANINDEYLRIVLKGIGITYLGHFGYELCADAGERAIGEKIILATNIFVLILAMPLYIGVFELLGALIEG